MNSCNSETEIGETVALGKDNFAPCYITKSLPVELPLPVPLPGPPWPPVVPPGSAVVVSLAPFPSSPPDVVIPSSIVASSPLGASVVVLLLSLLLTCPFLHPPSSAELLNQVKPSFTNYQPRGYAEAFFTFSKKLTTFTKLQNKVLIGQLKDNPLLHTHRNKCY